MDMITTLSTYIHEPLTCFYYIAANENDCSFSGPVFASAFQWWTTEKTYTTDALTVASLNKAILVIKQTLLRQTFLY